jgi:hypothetical protein
MSFWKAPGNWVKRKFISHPNHRLRFT